MFCLGDDIIVSPRTLAPDVKLQQSSENRSTVENRTLTAKPDGRNRLKSYADNDGDTKRDNIIVSPRKFTPDVILKPSSDCWPGGCHRLNLERYINRLIEREASYRHLSTRNRILTAKATRTPPSGPCVLRRPSKPPTNCLAAVNP